MTKTLETHRMVVHDADGNLDTVVEHTDYVDVSAGDGPAEWLAGLKSYRRRSDGELCSVEGVTFFKVVRTGTKLMRGYPPA